MIKQPPLRLVRLDRIHPHANEKMPGFANEQIETLSPDSFPPCCRLIAPVKNADAALLLQQQNAAEKQWQGNGAANEYGFATAAEDQNHSRRNQSGNPARSRDRQQEDAGETNQRDQQQQACARLFFRQA